MHVLTIAMYAVPSLSLILLFGAFIKKRGFNDRLTAATVWFAVNGIVMTPLVLLYEDKKLTEQTEKLAVQNGFEPMNAKRDGFDTKIDGKLYRCYIQDRELISRCELRESVRADSLAPPK